MKTKSPLQLVLPIVLGYLPIGMTFGLLAFQQNLHIFPTILLSSVVFAGSAQFAVLGMLAIGNVPLVQIFITTYLINLRHFILSLAYVPNTKTWTLFEKIRFFPILTDENFAILSSTKEIKKDPKKAYAISLMPYASWQVATILGFYFGKLIPDPNRFGLDFALTAMFLGIIVLFIDRFEQVITFIAAILFMIIFYLMFDVGRLSVILSALCASFVGWRFSCRKKSTS